MRPEAYETLAGREERYWWHRARRSMAADLLRLHGLIDGGRVVDLGCGVGGNLTMPAAASPRSTVGVDLSPIALAHARARYPDARLVRADLNRPLPFADASIDAVTIFNVLYHQWIRDDVSILGDVHRILRPGGLLLATEPAFGSFTRQMDEVVMTRRRYRIPEFADMCRQAQLDVRFASYFGSFGAPVVWLMKALDRWFHRSSRGHIQADLKPIAPVTNELLYVVARTEAFAVAHGVRLPIGLTLVCVARKPAFRETT